MKKQTLAMLAIAIMALLCPNSLNATQASVWNTLPAWHGDTETAEARQERLRVIDEAIDRAVQQATCSASSSDCKAIWFGSAEDLRWLLIGQAFFETHLAQHIHADQCRVKLRECDGGKAKGLWQVHSNAAVPYEEWKTLAGVSQESTDKAAYVAARVLAKSFNQCKTLEGAISLYATGRSCSWAPAGKRARWIEENRAKHSPRFGSAG